jgi:hypothetical protein
MLPDYKKETLADWLNRFLVLAEEKFSSHDFSLNSKEDESIGNAFNIYIIEDTYFIDIFWDGLSYTYDSTFEEIKAGILEMVEKNKVEYENIVKFIIAKRSYSVQNLDFLDLSMKDDKVYLSGYQCILFPKESKVVLFDKEYTIDEYIKKYSEI